MNRIKSFIKRNRFLSVCALIIVALLLFWLFYSYFPSVETQNGNYYIIFGGWNPEYAEGKTLKGIVILFDEARQNHILTATYNVTYNGTKPEKFPEESQKDFSENYKYFCSTGYDALQTVEEAERLGYYDFNCGYYLATAEWEYQSEKGGDWIILKKEYVRIYIIEEIEEN